MGHDQEYTNEMIAVNEHLVIPRINGQGVAIICYSLEEMRGFLRAFASLCKVRNDISFSGGIGAYEAPRPYCYRLSENRRNGKYMLRLGSESTYVDMGYEIVPFYSIVQLDDSWVLDENPDLSQLL